MSLLLDQDNIASLYFSKRNSLLGALPKNASIRDGYADSFYPTPLALESSEISGHKRIQTLLAKALVGMVTNYFNDSQLQEIVPLSSSVRKELERLKDVPYEIGYIRPDYIYRKNGQPVICEINARFGFNGSYMTAYVNHAMKMLYPGLGSLAGIEEFKEQQSSLFRSPTFLVKGREEGYDIHLLMSEHPNVTLIAPNNMSHLLNQEAQPTILCELHQDELKTHLRALCNYMLRGGTVINDPRTVLIVHDKRLMAAFSNKKILSRYLNRSEAETLSRAFIPSFLTVYSKDMHERALKDKDSFILKKAISGKGDGLVIGYATSDTVWRKALQKKNYILQPFINQKVFQFWHPYLQEYKDFYIAGTLPMYNSQAYGPGLARIYQEHPHKFFRFIQPMVQT